MVGGRGIEPLTPSMSRKCSTSKPVLTPMSPRAHTGVRASPVRPSREGFVPHIIPRTPFAVRESWSEWQDLRLSLRDIEIFEVFVRSF
jgi:hypothetical protein